MLAFEVMVPLWVTVSTLGAALWLLALGAGLRARSILRDRPGTDPYAVALVDALCWLATLQAFAFIMACSIPPEHVVWQMMAARIALVVGAAILVWRLRP